MIKCRDALQSDNNKHKNGIYNYLSLTRLRAACASCGDASEGIKNNIVFIQTTFTNYYKKTRKPEQ